MSTVTAAEHTAIGALAGVLEVSVMQPTVAIKNAIASTHRALSIAQHMHAVMKL